MRCACLTLLAAALIAVGALHAGARDLGVRGAVWPPVEADLLANIEDTLLGLERSGELARLNEAAAARARERVEAPAPVPGISPATEESTRWFDPSVTVGEDILGPGGAMIAAAGVRVNPLAYRPLTGSLLFIDGTHPVEVQWALEQAMPSKIVLLSGRPLELARTHGRAFFFDQAGALAERFGLSATPARIAQHEMLLRIDEIVLHTTDGLRTADGLRPAKGPRTTDDPPSGVDIEQPAAGAGSEPVGRDEESTP